MIKIRFDNGTIVTIEKQVVTCEPPDELFIFKEYQEEYDFLPLTVVPYEVGLAMTFLNELGDGDIIESSYNLSEDIDGFNQA